MTAPVELDVVARKEAELREALSGYPTLAIAYSGGVDSSFLAAIAHEELGERCHLVLADSPSIPRAEVHDARRLAEARGWNLAIVKTQEFGNEDYLKNDTQRCYFCKTALFIEMNKYARANGIAVLAYGAMADDVADHRPGHKAAAEFRVIAPLQDVGLGKEEIRSLSRARDLPTASKASFACLASRFPTGTPINRETMSQVEQAEEILRDHGFHQFRARHHGDMCRIEVGEDEVARLCRAETREDIVRRIKEAGYRFVTLDLSGYRMGSVSAGRGKGAEGQRDKGRSAEG